MSKFLISAQNTEKTYTNLNAFKHQIEVSLATNETDLKSNLINITIDEKKNIGFIEIIGTNHYQQCIKKAEQLQILKTYYHNDESQHPNDLDNDERLVKFNNVLKHLKMNPQVEKQEKRKQFSYEKFIHFINPDVLDKSSFKGQTNSSSDLDYREAFELIFNQAEQIMIMNMRLNEFLAVLLYSDQYLLENIEIHALPQRNLDQITIYNVSQFYGQDVGYYFQFITFFNQWMVGPIIAGVLVASINYIYNIDVNQSIYDSIYGLAIVIWANIFYIQWTQREKQIKILNGSAKGVVERMERNTGFGNIKTNIIEQDDFVSGEQKMRLSQKILLKNILLNVLSASVLLFITFIFLFSSLNLRKHVLERHTLVYSRWINDFRDKYEDTKFMSLFPLIYHVFGSNALYVLYAKVMKTLTPVQLFKTIKQHGDSIILKNFIFLLLITFLDYSYIAYFTFSIEKLASELKSLFFVDEVRRFVFEIGIPYISLKSQEISKNANKKSSDKDLVIKESQEEFLVRAQQYVQLRDYDSSQDYIEVILNYGYLTLYASSFPLAPVFIIVYHYLQSVNDLYKLQYLRRRPIPRKSSGIGIWNKILNFLTVMSALSNLFLFAFSSEQITNLLPSLFEVTSGVVSNLTNSLISGEIPSEAPIFQHPKEKPKVNLKSQPVPVSGQQEIWIVTVFLLQHVVLLLIWALRQLVKDQNHWPDIVVKRHAYQQNLTLQIQASKSNNVVSHIKSQNYLQESQII